MNVKLYDENAYIKEFEATVTGCFITADGWFELTLDKTAFFPEEGGQTPDKGTINGFEVLDVQIKDGDICHLVKFFVPEGTVVNCKIDWEHRFSNMQMHTGEHIFSGLVHREYGYNNVGFHLSENSATMDYDGKLTDSEIKRLERLANEAIWANKKVCAFYPDRKELETMEYRSKKDISGDVRIVAIEDIDACACCAPHVANTGEIGLLKITSWENYKGGVRLNYLCGERALKDYQRLADMETELSRNLNAKKGDITETVGKLKTSVSELEYSNVSLRRMRVSDVCESSDKGILFLEDEDSDLLRFAMGELKSKFCGLCVVLAGNDENGYKFMAECDGNDLMQLSESLKNNFEIRGGGRNGCLQGSIIGKRADILNFFEKNCVGMFEN